MHCKVPLPDVYGLHAGALPGCCCRALRYAEYNDTALGCYPQVWKTLWGVYASVFIWMILFLFNRSCDVHSASKA